MAGEGDSDESTESMYDGVEVESPLRGTDLDDVLRFHRDYVNAHRAQWLNHRESAADNFWRDKNLTNIGAIDAWAWVRDVNEIPAFAINRMWPWVVSYVASLFYRGFSSDVTPDDVYEDVPGNPTKPMKEAVKVLLDRFFNKPSFAKVTEQAFTACLLYPHGAFYLKEVKKAARPVDRFVAEFMPPWECVWDRFAQSVETSRYIGRLWRVSFEEAQSVYGASGEDCEKVAIVRGDPLRHGLETSPYYAGQDKHYVQILDLNYPLAGKRCVYLLDAGFGRVKTLLEEEARWRDADGQVALNVEPLVLKSLPEHPLYGVPYAATIYALERENNSYAAWQAQAVKIEALRKVFVDYSKLMSEGGDSFSNNTDAAIVGVQPGALSQGPGAIASWLAQPPATTSGLQLRQYIEQMFQAVQGTAPFSRGQPTQYIPATESANLAAYSETTLGMIRAKVDRAVARLGQTYLLALAGVAGETLKVRTPKQDDIVALPTSQLRLRWTIRIVDGANTPAKTEGQKRDSLQIAPLLLQLASTASNMQIPPETRVAMQRVWDELVQRFGLDDSLKWSNVVTASSKQTEAAPQLAMGEPQGIVPPAAAPGPAPVPAANGMNAEQAAAVNSDAAAMADLNRAFSEGGM